MSNKDLGPIPEPVIEDREPNPGGVDAVPQDEADLARDLDPDRNPGVNDELPEEIAETDDEKSQSPAGAADDAESGTERSPDAGQQAEDGSAEPPA